MKRLTLLLLSAVMLTACSPTPLFGSKEPVSAAPTLVKRKSFVETKPLMVNGAEVKKVDFKPGISSASVERLAKAEACTGGHGAGLVTAQGPVEIYRMACDNGKVFMARCELRQCTPMNASVASR